MSTLFIALAGALAFVWFLVHLIVGGKQIAQPLRAATDLSPVVRDTQYLCWHFTSLSIFAMSALFALALLTGNTAFALSAVLLSAGFALTGIGLVLRLHASHAQLPQGWLFLPVAGLGLAGLLL